MPPIVTIHDAAMQELQSAAAFSGVLTTANEIARAFGVQSPALMMVINVLVLAGSMGWQYYDNGGWEELTIPKQLSRLGVDATIFFFGIGVYGIFLAVYGGDEKELAKHLQISGKDATWVTPFIAYVGSSIVFAMNKGIANIILLIPAAIQTYRRGNP